MNAKPLTREEEELAALLQRAGLSRLAARALAALLRGGSWGAPDLAHAAGLARQEVSVAARELGARGLVQVSQLRREGGGRPANRYHLADADALLRLERERRAALLDELGALDELRKRAQKG